MTGWYACLHYTVSVLRTKLVNSTMLNLNKASSTYNPCWKIRVIITKHSIQSPLYFFIRCISILYFHDIPSFCFTYTHIILLTAYSYIILRFTLNFIAVFLMDRSISWTCWGYWRFLAFVLFIFFGFAIICCVCFCVYVQCALCNVCCVMFS